MLQCVRKNLIQSNFQWHWVNLFEDFKDIEGVYNEIRNAVEDIVNCARIHIIANKLTAFS